MQLTHTYIQTKLQRKGDAGDFEYFVHEMNSIMTNNNNNKTKRREKQLTPGFDTKERDP